MLSAVSRVATLRLGSSVAASASRVTAAAPWQANIAIRAAVRPFATAGRPKTTTTSKSTATKKKTTTAAAKKTTKKPVAKKTVKKAVKAKAKPKPNAVKKPKKEVSPEKQAIEQRKELRKIALFAEPKGLPSSSWNLYVADELKGSGNPVDGANSKLKTISQEFKNLSASQQDSLQSRAEQNKAANTAAYRAWVETFTPEDIRKANNARHLLKRKFNFPAGQLRLIKDARLPKEAATAYALFVKAKWASGEIDTQGGPVQNAAAALGAAWKSLSAAEKKPYEDLHLAERERYVKEMKDVLGVEVKPRARSV